MSFPLLKTTSWWRSLDPWILTSVFLLIGIGVVLILTVSPAVALQHNWTPFVLFKRHMMILIPGVIALLLTSGFAREHIISVSMLVWILAWVGCLGTCVVGVEIKGARRWLAICGFSLQPSEFLRTAAIIVNAWLLGRSRRIFGVPEIIWSLLLCAITLAPLALQPDFGMIFLVLSTFLCQYFLWGLPLFWVGGGIAASFAGLVSAYFCFPHVAQRVHDFLGGQKDRFGTHYQITQALLAFSAGGLWGRGPGAGTVLDTLPDGHADFIFAVAGEEFGFVICLAIMCFYGVVIFRGLLFASREHDLFCKLASSGIVMSLALQVFLNLGSVLHIIPTKGTTLPFLSYGGSAFLCACWGIGILVALTRRYRFL